MDQLWYYAHDGQSLGPVPFSELKKLVAAGQLLPSDSVCPVGSPQWQAASSVTDLFDSLPPEPIAMMEIDDSMTRRIEEDDSRNRDRDRNDDRDRERSNRRSRDDWDDRRGPPRDALEPVKLVLRRSFTVDFSSIQPTDDEARQLKRAGINEPSVQRYLIWRKSLLWFIVVPSAFAALFHLISVLGMEKEERDAWSRFGLAMKYIQALTLVALPITAAIAASKFDQPRKSMTILLIGALIAFGARIIEALIPAEHLLDTKTSDERAAAGFLMGLMLYITLMPTVLSPLPAIGRACSRLKSLMPASIVPGWGLIASAPMYLLLGFASFVLIYQMVGNFLLVFGLLLWIGAPLIYFRRTDLWIRPLTRNKDIKSLAQMHMLVLISVALGITLIVIFLLTAKLGGKYLVGFEKSSSLVRPWNIDLHNFWIEFVGRSLFLTVVFADLLIQMNLSIWNQEKTFYRTESAADYDKDMESLQQAIAPAPKSDDDESIYNPKRSDRDDDRRRD